MIAFEFHAAVHQTDNMDVYQILRALMEVYSSKQEELAKALEVNQSTISRWLNGKDIGDMKVKKYERIVELARQHGIADSVVAEAKGSSKRENIDEIDATAGLGGGGLSLEEVGPVGELMFHGEVVRDHWRFPPYVLNRLNAKPQHIKAFAAQGDSMSPTVENGDVVFADVRHRVPSPPGVYVLADEFGGIVVKRLEVVSRPSDDPIRVRISSDNPRHGEKELILEEINIIGRLVGRFTS